jgi:tetratricopeptide (TPR) repeat protein
MEADPNEALAIASKALGLCAKADATADDLAYARGSAQKERANALRYLGRYLEALEALEQAEGEFSSLHTGEFEIGIVEQIRATVLREQSDYPGALRSAKRALGIFRTFGDRARALRVEFSLANLRYETGDLEGARTAYEGLLAALEERDPSLLASLLNNLGHALLQLGDSEAARSHLVRAYSLFKETGRRTEILRVQWALARVQARAHQIADAIQGFGEVAEAFRASGMRIDSALVRLDLAEALIEDDRRTEAAELCREVVSEFLDQNVKVAAATALARLRESAAGEFLSVAPIHEARVALEECRPPAPAN